MTDITTVVYTALIVFGIIGLTEVALAWYDIRGRDKTDDDIQEQRATELRKIREKKRLKRKPVKKNKLAEICEIAKSKGMSYGQYMAEQYKKEVTIR